MSFNWPTLPFIGTEVETFAAAYRDLAEAILEDMELGIHDQYNRPKVPYRDPSTVKEFLLNGYPYACFIIKQRAGNSGPGTDFNLGSSPFGPEDSGAAQHWKDNTMNGWIMEHLGCIFEDKAMADCYAKNRENEPGLPEDGYMPSGDNGDGSFDPNKLNSEDFDALLDLLKENNHPDCEAFIQQAIENLQGTIDNKTNNTLTSAKTMLAYIIGIIAKNLLNIATVLPVTYFLKEGYIEMLSKAVQWLFMLRYLNGTGGVLTNNDINYGIPHAYADQWIREWYASYFVKFAKYAEEKGFTPTNHDDYGNYDIEIIQESTPSTSSGLSAWGMTAGQKKYTVYGVGTIWHNTFGTCQVITDGTSLINMTRSNIKGIRDDYDFRYGWAIVRDEVGDGVAGDPFPDSSIQSGANYTSDATTICSAAMKNFPGDGHNLAMDIPYLIKKIVAHDHGHGKKEGGEWEEALSGFTKPFAINLSW